jgi:quinol-cytochrome oxidoreductase complex cytochrome b subunit
MRRVPLHHWLATLPGLLILLGVPFANRVQARVLGMPFLLAWIVGCVLLTSLVMAIVGRLDDERARRARSAGPPTGPGRAP